MGYGQGPYGVTPFGAAPISFDAQPAKVLHSSRKIDGKFRTLSIDDDGNADGMDDVAQRVMLLTSYALRDEPELIGEDFANRREDSIRTALSILTAKPQPSIRIDQIETVSFAPGHTGTRVVYTNLLTNTKTSITL